MEFIKRKILFITTTGTTTGCTVTGMTRYEVPDLNAYYIKYGCTKYIITGNTGVTYNMKILLTQDTTDIGFFDAYMLSGATGVPINYTPYTVTGTCTSRLPELRKYTTSTVFASQYVTGGNYSTDGVDLANSNPASKIIYYLGGIKYTDLLTGFTSGSTFIFTSLGYTSPSFINKPIYKDPNKENIISNPKISDDVFIIRQELSAFDRNYRLEYIKNMVDLETYAGGNFFNIVKNS
jgi:hypothetical protein